MNTNINITPMKAGKALPIVYDLRDFKGTALEKEDLKMNPCI